MIPAIHRLNIQTGRRLLSTSTAAATSHAQNYNNARASYKRRVKLLRKQYLEDHLTQTRLDEEKRAAERAKVSSEKAQRQYERNVRTVANTMRHMERMARKNEEFERHLEEVAARREARKGRFEKARRLLIAELEEEAPLWMTTHEEVEERLGSAEAIQNLWSNPYHIGALPEDAAYWRFGSVAMDMSRSYLTVKEILLEKMLDEAFFDANLDKSYWTGEKLEREKEMATRAKLRAMVRKEGRRVLLERQAQWMRERFERKGMEEGVTVRMPPMSLSVLANEQAMMEEGKRVILENPEKFLDIRGGVVKGLKQNDDESYPMIIGDVPQAIRPEPSKERRQFERERKEFREKLRKGGGTSTLDLEEEKFEPFIEKPMDDPALKDYPQEIIESFNSNYRSLPKLTDGDIDWLTDKLSNKIKEWEAQAKATQSNQKPSPNDVALSETEKPLIANAKDILSKPNITDDDLTQVAQQLNEVPAATDLNRKHEAYFQEVDDNDLTIQNALSIISKLTTGQQFLLEGLDVGKFLQDDNVPFEDIVKIFRDSIVDKGDTKLTDKEIKIILMVEKGIMNDENVLNDIARAQEEMLLQEMKEKQRQEQGQLEGAERDDDTEKEQEEEGVAEHDTGERHDSVDTLAEETDQNNDGSDKKD